MELLRDWFRRSFSDPQVVILGLFLVIGLAIVVGLGTWLAPMFASIVIAYLLEAIVERLQRIGMPRLPAVIVVFLLFITILLFLFFGLVPLVSRQLTQLVQQFPSYIATGQEVLRQAWKSLHGCFPLLFCWPFSWPWEKEKKLYMITNGEQWQIASIRNVCLVQA